MKQLGMGIVLLASLSLGVVELLGKRERLRCLRELCDALALFRAGLADTRAPLPRLTQETGKKARGRAGLFFHALEEKLLSLGTYSFSELWGQAVDETMTPLTPEERESMRCCGVMLGRFALEEQLAALDQLQRQLENIFTAEQRRYRDEKKLSLWLPTAAGALLVILLL